LEGMDKVSGGGGGKRVSASKFPFSSFIVAVMSSLFQSFPLGVGTCVLLPLPGELLMYWCAVQMSSSVASSNHSFQWSFLALKISLASLLHASLLGVARILISNNLSTAQFVHVSQATSVKQMWENLKAVHEHRGQQSITTLRCTLYQTCARDGDDVVAHLTKMHSIQVELHHMGSIVPDRDFTNILISSLPASWDPFTMSYLGSQTGDRVLTSQQFIAIIRDECNCQKSNGGDGGTETVLTAQSLKRTAKKRKAVEPEKTKKACFTCGRTNHLAKDSFFKGKPKCEKCGRFNHETSECRSAEKGKE